MSDWSISKQLKALSLAMAAGMVIVAVIGAVSTLRFISSIDDTLMMSEEIALVGAIQEDVLKAREAELHYRLDWDPQDIRVVDENLSEIAQYRAQFDAMAVDDPALREMLANALSGLAAYRRDLGRTVDLQARRDAAVEQIATVGSGTREAITQLMEAARRAADPSAVFSAATAQQEFILAWLYLERFLLTNSDDTFADYQRHAAAALGALETLAQRFEPLGPGLDGALAQIGAFTAAASEARAAIVERNALHLDLDAASMENLAGLDVIIAEVSDKQADIVIASERLSTLALIALLGLSAIVIAAGLLIARRFANGIDASITTAVGEMEALAGGDLEVEVTGADRDNELGKIARALTVFRDNALRGRELEAERVALEKEQRREKAAREAEARELEQAHARKAEAERKSMIDELSSSIGAVVAAAADGDFSRRIETRLADPALNDMASGVNRLLDNVDGGLAAMSDALDALAGGDLTAEMRGSYRGVFAALQTNLGEAMASLSAMLKEIARESAEVDGEAVAMSSQSDQLAQRAEQQAASLEETSAAMEEIAAAARSAAESAESAGAVAEQASAQVDDAGRVVGSAIEAMGDIRAASERIGEIVGVIDGIAFQTNLLALNASVEAARAGSAGKGFAVVATEVRALAQRSSEASHDIKTLIEESANQVRRGVELVEATGATLEEIVGAVRQMAGSLGELLTTGREQATGIQEVTTALSQLDAITQKNAALADQSRTSAEGLKSRSDRMGSLVSRFRVGGEGPGPMAVAAE